MMNERDMPHCEVAPEKARKLRKAVKRYHTMQRQRVNARKSIGRKKFR